MSVTRAIRRLILGEVVHARIHSVSEVKVVEPQPKLSAYSIEITESENGYLELELKLRSVIGMIYLLICFFYGFCDFCRHDCFQRGDI